MVKIFKTIVAIIVFLIVIACVVGVIISNIIHSEVLLLIASFTLIGLGFGLFSAKILGYDEGDN